MPYKDTGTLVAKAYTAGEALPVKNTTVRISGADEENRRCGKEAAYRPLKKRPGGTRP